MISIGYPVRLYVSAVKRLALCVPLWIFVSGCSQSEQPSGSASGMQSLLAEYAPDLTIGDRVSAAARQRYQLRVAPYVGYRDSTYASLDGVRHLNVQVDEYVDDGRPRVSDRARIRSVFFVVWDSASAARSLHRLTARLGAPSIHCQQSPIPLTMYQWGRNDDGVHLLMRWPHRLNDSGHWGVGELRFGKLPGMSPDARPEAACRSV
jgi:hypothetical protein